jgi:hypothetical protein
MACSGPAGPAVGHGVFRGAGSGSHLSSTLRKRPQFHRLREIVVHPFAGAALPIAGHGIGRDGHDRNVSGRPDSRMRRVASKPSYSAASGSPSSTRSYFSCCRAATASIAAGDGAGPGTRVSPVVATSTQLVGLGRPPPPGFGRHAADGPPQGHPCASAVRGLVAVDLRRPRFGRQGPVRPVSRKTAVNQNVEPSPSLATFTPILPPINSTSCLAMARPRPVPPYLRVIGCVRLHKRREQCRRLVLCPIPMPVSATEKRSVTLPVFRLSTPTSHRPPHPVR